LHQKLYSTLSVAVGGIEDIDRLMPTIENLGRRHAKWGVVRANYEAVVDCFLWTLQNYIFSFMPNDNAMYWCRDVTDAWEWALKFIGTKMADAAEAEAEEEARIRDHNEALEYCRKLMMEETKLSRSHKNLNDDDDDPDDEHDDDPDPDDIIAAAKAAARASWTATTTPL
jgi:hemoglobin-like flavoprotein